MRRLLRFLAVLAIVIGVGLLVYGVVQFSGPQASPGLLARGPRPSPEWAVVARELMAVGAMLITAGVIGVRR